MCVAAPGVDAGLGEEALVKTLPPLSGRSGEVCRLASTVQLHCRFSPMVLTFFLDEVSREGVAGDWAFRLRLAIVSVAGVVVV